MSNSTATAGYDRITAVAAVVSVVLSALAVVVTLHVAYVQDKSSQQQNQYSHALGYADIYFSEPITTARETVDALYLGAYDRIVKSSDPNAEVAALLVTSQQQLTFDRLMAMYEQIAACANTAVCSSDVTGQLYGRDIQALYENWYGEIAARRKLLRANDYGCQIAKYLGRPYPPPGCN
jgi:hypothetical protein